MIKTRVSQLINCHHCAVRSLCIPHDLNFSDIEELNTLMSNMRLIPKKNYIYHAHSEMKNLYTIYSGSCKEYYIDANGNECVTTFYFPGDMIGWESLSQQKYMYSIIALEDVQVCVIPLTGFFSLMESNPNIMKRFINIASLKMQNDQRTRMGVTANERVCDFLLNIISRMHERNPDANKISLPMSQIEISSFLGIAYETVNRIFQNLKSKKIIKLNNKTLEILDLPELERLGRLDYTITI